MQQQLLVRSRLFTSSFNFKVHSHKGTKAQRFLFFALFFALTGLDRLFIKNEKNQPNLLNLRETKLGSLARKKQNKLCALVSLWQNCV